MKLIHFLPLFKKNKEENENAYKGENGSQGQNIKILPSCFTASAVVQSPDDKKKFRRTSLRSAVFV